MWIPASIYERLPHFWLIVGIVMMVSAIYLGFDYRWSTYYFGGGFICCLWSITIIVARTRRRNRDQCLPFDSVVVAACAEIYVCGRRW